MQVAFDRTTGNIILLVPERMQLFDITDVNKPLYVYYPHNDKTYADTVLNLKYPFDEVRQFDLTGEIHTVGIIARVSNRYLLVVNDVSKTRKLVTEFNSVAQWLSVDCIRVQHTETTQFSNLNDALYFIKNECVFDAPVLYLEHKGVTVAYVVFYKHKGLQMSCFYSYVNFNEPTVVGLYNYCLGLGTPQRRQK